MIMIIMTLIYKKEKKKKEEVIVQPLTGSEALNFAAIECS